MRSILRSPFTSNRMDLHWNQHIDYFSVFWIHFRGTFDSRRHVECQTDRYNQNCRHDFVDHDIVLRGIVAANSNRIHSAIVHCIDHSWHSVDSIDRNWPVDFGRMNFDRTMAAHSDSDWRDDWCQWRPQLATLYSRYAFHNSAFQNLEFHLMQSWAPMRSALWR